MKYILTPLIAAGLLSACSTLANHQTQDITIKTPGAENARCLIENEDMKYAARTDETIEMMKSPHDLVVRCTAPGNREQTVHVKRDVDEWVVANVANGFVPGAAYDYFSRGAFIYPEVISVNFVGIPVKPYPLPQYMSDDLKMNHQYGTIEHMGGGGVLLTEENKYEEPAVIEKKNNPYAGSTRAQALDIKSPTKSGMALDSIHRQYNPKISYDPTEEDK